MEKLSLIQAVEAWSIWQNLIKEHPALGAEGDIDFDFEDFCTEISFSF